MVALVPHQPFLSDFRQNKLEICHSATLFLIPFFFAPAINSSLKMVKCLNKLRVALPKPTNSLNEVGFYNPLQ